MQSRPRHPQRVLNSLQNDVISSLSNYVSRDVISARQIEIILAFQNGLLTSREVVPALQNDIKISLGSRLEVELSGAVGCPDAVGWIFCRAYFPS